MTSNSKFHMTLTNLAQLSKDDIKGFFNSFDTVITDCDGVLWLENVLLEGSPQALNGLRDLGKKIYFVTNNSTKLQDELTEKAQNMGYICKTDEFITTAILTVRYLKERSIKKVYLIGSKALAYELDKAGIKYTGLGPDAQNIIQLVRTFPHDPEIGAVVVGFDEHLSYPKIVKAATYLENPDVLFVATNTDERFPIESPVIIPGTGVFVRAIETCVFRLPFIIGKPSSYMADAIIKEHSLDPKRTLMIGDRCNSDILLGRRCGMQTLLVLSGVTSLEDVQKWKASKNPADNELVPDVYLNNLKDLLPFLE